MCGLCLGTASLPHICAPAEAPPPCRASPTYPPMRGSETLHPPHLPFPPPPHLHSSQVETPGVWDGAPEALGLAVSAGAAGTPARPQGSGASGSSPSKSLGAPVLPLRCGQLQAPHPIRRLRTDPQQEEAGRSPQGPRRRRRGARRGLGPGSRRLQQTG